LCNPFNAVVVGASGTSWGTLAGASLIGFLQKGIEWFNPSNNPSQHRTYIGAGSFILSFNPSQGNPLLKKGPSKRRI